MLQYNPIPLCHSRYGAPMGRGDSGPLGTGPIVGKVHLVRIRLNNGGYDNGGAYWGHGAPMYYAEGQTQDGETFYRYFRAADRAAAKARMPGCKFYR